MALTELPTWYWHQPARDLTIVGWGSARTPGPIRVGGMPFRDQQARMMTPARTMVRRRGRTHFLHAAGGSEPLPVPVPTTPTTEYGELVRHALKAIDVGEVDKVVVARSERVEHTPDVPTLLDVLAARYPRCAVFAFSDGDRTFVGASPEVLVRVFDGRVETAAVAGTATTGEALLDSAKDHAEHRFVIDHICERLDAAGVALDPVAETAPVSHEGVSHLRTPITGRADVHVLDLVAALHPTPAVAGTPVQAATDWLADHEGFDRGWYAGAVGWVDAQGNGELCVAIRSAVVDSCGCTLFAGSGIVAESDPEAERRETALKMRWMRDPILAS